MPHVDLLELPYFAGISLDAVVALVDLMEPKQFASGATIVAESDREPPPLFITTAGRITVATHLRDGTEQPLGEFGSPALFGEVEFFTRSSPVATVRALTAVSAFTLAPGTSERLLKAQNPAVLMFAFNIGRVACLRLSALAAGRDAARLKGC